MKYKNDLLYYMKITERDNRISPSVRWFKVDYKKNKFMVLKEEANQTFPEDHGKWQRMSPSSLFTGGMEYIHYEILTEGEMMLELI